jgi:hypothetical protein
LSARAFHDLGCQPIIEIRFSTGFRLSRQTRNMFGKDVLVYFKDEEVEWDVEHPWE